MITVKFQSNSHCEIFQSGNSIGYISVHRNAFHARNGYLYMALAQYDPAIAAELFRELRSKLSCPLQVMLNSWECEKIAFLISGGFQRKRQCYEMNVSAKDLIAPVKEIVPTEEAGRGEKFYSQCGDLLYESYAKTHEAINPLTAARETFLKDLPDKTLFYREDGTVIHFAFVNGNEIAYVGTGRPSDFHRFAQSLLSKMFSRYERVTFECDDCDSIAMNLRACFQVRDCDSFDTYILE